MGFVDFTKLSFTLSSLAQPFDQMGSIPEHVFVILSQRKAYAGRFQKKQPEQVFRVKKLVGRPKLELLACNGVHIRHAIYHGPSKS